MDLWNKLFTSKKKQSFKPSHTNSSSKPFPFSKEQVRVLLYRECDWRGRKLLFDSTALRKIALTGTINTKSKYHFTEVVDGFGYNFLKKSPDTKTIGEMIFGAVAMTYRETSLKIHWLSSPARLLCTQVFVSPLASSLVSTLERTSDHSMSYTSSWESSLSYIGDNSDKKSVNSPLEEVHYSTYTTLTSVAIERSIDSGYNASSSKSSENITPRSSFSQSDLSFVTFSSTSSRKSSQNRLSRNLSTTFVNNNSVRALDGMIKKAVNGKHTKLGLAVCVTLTESLESEMQYYYMEHIPLIESMMNRLLLIVTQAYIEKTSFFSAIIKGFETATQFIYDMFRGPIITKPFWMALAKTRHVPIRNGKSYFSYDVENMSYNFIERLYKLLIFFDTKGTNFFLSTLITAALTHHLGWISTVAPNEVCKSKLNRTRLKCCFKLNDICKKYPRNYLWAQLIDLYGLNSHPFKICQTIISCPDSGVLEEMITVLTYFIRCRKLHRAFFEPIFENALLDRIMNYISENGDFYTNDGWLFYNKHLNTEFVTENNTEQIVSDDDKLFMINSGLCEPRHGLRNRDYLFNLRLCSSLHDQPWQHINLKYNENKSDNFLLFSENTEDFPSKTNLNSYYNIHNADMHLPNKRNESILYHLKSNENTVQKLVECSFNNDIRLLSNTHQHKFEAHHFSLSKDASKLNAYSKHMESQSKDIPNKNYLNLNNTGLKHMNTDKYLNLSDLITKNSLGYTTTQSHYDTMNFEKANKVHFILGDNENISEDSISILSKKDSKIIPQVDKEFIYSKMYPNNFSDININQNRLDISVAHPVYCEQFDNIPIKEHQQVTASTSFYITNNDLVMNVESDDNSGPTKFQSEQNHTSNNMSGVKLMKRIAILPLLKTRTISMSNHMYVPGFTASLFGSVNSHYVPDMVIQGTTSGSDSFESLLFGDLNGVCTLGNVLLDDACEGVSIVANLEKLKVQAISSHTYVFANGISVNITAMSRLVSNMLEAVQQMWRLKISADHCTKYIEYKLLDMYLKSEVLAEILLNTDFCEISCITSSLGIEVADIPLLMSIASSHSPQVTKKYSLSFR